MNFLNWNYSSSFCLRFKITKSINKSLCIDFQLRYFSSRLPLPLSIQLLKCINIIKLIAFLAVFMHLNSFGDTHFGFS